MEELKAKSLWKRTVLGLGLACAALAGACGGNDTPMPAGGEQLPGGQLPGGNMGDPCGGIMGLTCSEGKYCDFESKCGYADMQGTCRPMPTECEEECTTKVCGCDGLTYCNPCLAHFAGVDDTTCGDMPPPPTTR